MQGTNLRLSKEELDAVIDNEYFLVRNEIVRKTFDRLALVENALKEVIQKHPAIVNHSDCRSGKIYKGENYLGLPYVLLEFPRKYSADDTFSFRTMLWWGNELSFSMHVQGKSLNHFVKWIQQHISELAMKGNYFFCINESPWHYHFKDDNYIGLNELMANNASQFNPFKSEFIKIASKIEFKDFHQLEKKVAGDFRNYLWMLNLL